MYTIEKFTKHDTKEIVDFIVGIQRKEFLLDIDETDQEDLLTIEEHYMQGGGNFWLAKNDENQLIGTIAVVFLNDHQAALKKMFVDSTHRNLKIGQALLDVLIDYCVTKEITAIYLGTTDKFEAAQHFYQKNHFQSISRQELPKDFPKLEVDNLFYVRTF